MSGAPERMTDPGDDFHPRQTLRDGKRRGAITIVTPTLLMFSLISSALALTGFQFQISTGLSFWLILNCFVCAAFFQISLDSRLALHQHGIVSRERRWAQHRSSVIPIAWSVAPVLLAALDSNPASLEAMAILSGLTLAGTFLLRLAFRAGVAVLSFCLIGFVLNSVYLPGFDLSLVSLALIGYFSLIGLASGRYYRKFEGRLKTAEKMACRARQLRTVMQNMGPETKTYFWRASGEGVVQDVSEDALFGGEGIPCVVGQGLDTLFQPSAERDHFLSRIAVRADVSSVDLQISPTGPEQSAWWRVSARPVYEHGLFVGYHGVATDISDQKARDADLKYLSRFDALTGILNRTSFMGDVAKLLTLPPGSGRERGVLWIDLDHFNWINDEVGHKGGDQVLQRAVERLKALCNEDDILCRLGGDEFAILIERDQQSDALSTFTASLCAALAEPYRLADKELRCVASIGFRRVDAEETDPGNLIREADLALYAAKSEGKGRWKEYSEDFKARIRGERDLAQDLRKAIGTDQMRLEFQPIVQGQTLEVVGFEALSRWEHPERGEIPPSEYIPVAEANGLIIELGEDTLRRAFVTAAQLPGQLKLGLNISPTQVHSPDLVPMVERLLEETKVNPEKLDFEITETVFLTDSEQVLDRLHRLKALGIRIVLDDFGTGFSSLSYLQRFSFDKLKLDQSFVQGLQTSEESRAIARATISMAHALGLTVTAEGVENSTQLEFLTQQNCDELQGFLFGRSILADDVQDLIGAHRSVRAAVRGAARVTSLYGR